MGSFWWTQISPKIDDHVDARVNGSIHHGLDNIFRYKTLGPHPKNWVAVKELKLSYHIGETLLFTIYTHYGNLI